ncbi:ABC transporter ATP-binding protein [Pseudoduganella namucuonensis]|uniref:Nucleoside ABC transporter ATP-binding protein n=1 Tax=Pseudoduganella namucuonensis TaxID=1035707 RepID=A0A1I7K8W9_9BURK|nr:ABC transporter ATP-binding protein [Pseudoduganella namucuonensis]SFU93851.1 nucleoside ABC transporter ATP-binding protein [Pseudoduganella namucuonensis]
MQGNRLETPRLELRGIRKRYDNGVLANDDVGLALRSGEIHALVGENGAGKSTVMKMIYGLERPSAGEMLLDGRPLRLRGPRDAIAAGIGLVPQHVQLVPSFSVAQNVVLGCEPMRAGLVDMDEAARRVRAAALRFGLEIDPLARAAGLSLGEQQRVEILKTLYRGASVLLLDEPGAVLAPAESRALFASLRALAEQGHAVLLITHKLSDVLDVSDSYTVLRGGRVTGRGSAREADAAELTRMIVGRAMAPAPSARAGRPGAAPLVSARELGLLRPDGAPRLRDVSFDIAAGEILGIAGVEGNGQDALAGVLAGLLAPDRGGASIGGRAFTGAGVRAARAGGVAAIPEDRLRDGAAPELSIADNAIAAAYHRAPLSRFGWLDAGAVRAMARRLIQRYGVAAQGPEQAIGSLSGGNMQKVVMGRELESRPRFLVASQPTRGVDIGAARELRRQLAELRDGGAAVLLISADLDEVLELSDRIAVLFQGRIVGHFRGGEAGAEELGARMTGARRDEGAAAMLDSPFSARGGVQA